MSHSGQVIDRLISDNGSIDIMIQDGFIFATATLCASIPQCFQSENFKYIVEMNKFPSLLTVRVQIFLNLLFVVFSTFCLSSFVFISSVRYFPSHETKRDAGHTSFVKY